MKRWTRISLACVIAVGVEFILSHLSPDLGGNLMLLVIGETIVFFVAFLVGSYVLGVERAERYELEERRDDIQVTAYGRQRTFKISRIRYLSKSVPATAGFQIRLRTSSRVGRLG